MPTIIAWIEETVAAIPLPVLEVWGRFAYLVGLGLAVCAFGRFTFRVGSHWGLGRERQTWNERAFLAIPLTFVLIVASGYAGSFIVLVPGAQTFESVKDLVVILCLVLLGYPALVTVPFAYGLSDLIEGVPPAYLLGWLPGYFINPACFWVAYQLIGMDPDFRRAGTWGLYLLAFAVFMALEPVLWGFICSDQFTPAVSYRTVTPALFFTTGLSWLLAPLAMLAALPLARRFQMFWAEIPGHVRQRALGSGRQAWEAGRHQPLHAGSSEPRGLPIRMFLLAPFIALVLVMVGITAYVALRGAESDATRLAERLHRETATNIRLRLDDYLTGVSQAGAEPTDGVASVMNNLPMAVDGRAFIVDRAGSIVASSAAAEDAVVLQAIAALREGAGGLAAFALDRQFHVDYVSERPLSRQRWLTYASLYPLVRLGRTDDWILVTAMPEASYLAGVQSGHSRTAMVFAVALLLSLGLAGAMAATVAAPLRRLSQAIGAFERGDLAERVPGSRLAELSVLSRSFNDMADRLQASFASLKAEVEMRERRERELRESEAERRRVEDLARKARDELAHAARLATMGELAASIAHEVNQPLAGVVTNANACLRWMARDVPDLEEARAAVQRIVRDGQRASEVVARVRAMARKTAAGYEPLDLNETIRSVVLVVEGEMRKQGVALTVDYASDLPPVTGDRVQLQQVVLNLMLNAMEAMSAVTGRPRDLTIATAGDGEQVRVSVCDSGTGVAPETMPRMFEAFYTTKPSGLGIGLSISRSIVEDHGGRLWAVANGEAGMTFHFTVGRAEPAR
jgi:C4-dicarboxylate-specific signal transduction histidine kinase